MSPGSTFNIVDVARGGHQIEQINDIQWRWHPKRNVMHPWPGAIGERHIMNATFAVHPSGPELLALFILGIFRDPEPEIPVEEDFFDPERDHSDLLNVRTTTFGLIALTMALNFPVAFAMLIFEIVRGTQPKMAAKVLSLTALGTSLSNASYAQDALSLLF